jgi:Zn-dependent protease
MSSVYLGVYDTHMELIIAIAIIILSIIFHEVAHGYVAYWLGDPTAKYAGRLTLNPVPHIDPIGSVLIPGLLALSGTSFLVGWAKGVPYNPYNLRYGKWGEAMVGFAGPLTNILIAFVCALLIRFDILAVLGSSALSVAVMVTLANLSLAILNLIPIPPLDGSKVVAAFLPYQLERSYRQLENLTYALGPFGLLIVLLVVFNVFSPYIGSLERNETRWT